MTIVLGLSGGSVAAILWGRSRPIKSFICVDLKESCEVARGWNPLQRVSAALSGRHRISTALTFRSQGSRVPRWGRRGGAAGGGGGEGGGRKDERKETRVLESPAGEGGVLMVVVVEEEERIEG